MKFLQKGFTSSAAVSVFLMCAIVFMVIAGVSATSANRTTCEAGYVFTHGYSGNAAQVLDAQGHGIPCN